jgi:hypothetical protein
MNPMNYVYLSALLFSIGASGVDRPRELAIDAAEAGVDAGYTAIQSGGANPPCSLASSNVRSGPDTASFGTSSPVIT